MASLIFNNLGFDFRPHGLEAANTALGAYMAAWSELENACSFAFADLAGLNSSVSTIIFDRVGTREQIEILVALIEASDAVDDPTKGRVAEFQKASVQRNKIVHAAWGLYNDQIARFWNGITSANTDDLVNETPKGKSLREKNIHNLADLERERARCVDLQEVAETIVKTHSQMRARAAFAEVQAMKRRAWPERYPTPYSEARDQEPDR